jgi:hypothetical protein
VVGVALVVALGVESGVVGLAFFGPIVAGIEISYFEHFVWNQPPSRLVCDGGWFIRCHKRQASGTDAVLGVEKLLEIFGEDGSKFLPG